MLFSELQELNEMSTVSRTRRMCVAVNPAKNRQGDEYFKLYNAQSESKADKLIRILFRKPEYVFHRNTGFNDWILSSSEKKDLMKFLSSKEYFTDAERNEYSITVFQKALILFNYEKGLGLTQNETFSLMLLKDHEGYLPLNLEMPNYNELRT